MYNMVMTLLLLVWFGHCHQHITSTHQHYYIDVLTKNGLDRDLNPQSPGYQAAMLTNTPLWVMIIKQIISLYKHCPRLHTSMLFSRRAISLASSLWHHMLLLLICRWFPRPFTSQSLLFWKAVYCLIEDIEMAVFCDYTVSMICTLIFCPKNNQFH